jgi:hypothetical protein
MKESTIKAHVVKVLKEKEILSSESLMAQAEKFKESLMAVLRTTF